VLAVGNDVTPAVGQEEKPADSVSLVGSRRVQLAADTVAELEQFALDPLVSPAVILAGTPLDQRYGLRAYCGRPARCGRVRFRVARRRCHRSTVPR
jgi:hypothetical protein